jgi:hypothetical protein
MALQREHLNPGDCISWDQYVVPHRGRLYKSAGKERENLRYSGGSLAVDYASKQVFIHHQVALTANLTLVGKRLLECNAREVGVDIKQYHADNGIFASKKFCDDCKLKQQKLTFSASNSHHQNGVAERYIGTISRMARSMLIHSALLWPRRHNINLWPMAMDHAAWIWNNLPMDDGLSPEENGQAQSSLAMIIYARHMYLDALHMYFTRNWLRVVRYRNGILDLVKESSLAIPRSMHRMLVSY